jgi:predicted dehydrogenase
MIGGSRNSFIGVVQRKAIALDGTAVLKAGCFSRNAETNRQTGEELGLAEERIYGNYREMAEREAGRSDKVDFAVVVTQNASHFEIARTFLQAGFNVSCDKPLTISSVQAEELAALARQKDLLFCVTYTKTGYPLVKQAREMIAHGDIGEVKFVQGEYLQDWLAVAEQKSGDTKLPLWRVDPKQAGESNCLADIGTHLENLVLYMTGLKLRAVCARLDTFGKSGGSLDDNATVLVEYENGARGVYWSSQIAYGNDNALRFRILGSKGSIEWDQENPNSMSVTYFDKPKAIISRGRDALYPLAQSFCRIPAGHPEGTFEAFSNIYKAFTHAILKRKAGEPLTAADMDYPHVEAGVDGVHFVEKCLESTRNGSVWVKF